MERLKKLRDRIDWLDTQIASLLNERMCAADEIGRIKRNHHEEVADQSREAHVLDQVENLVQHPILKENIANIYSEILYESRTAQRFLQSPSQPFRRIGVIGVGLMGGSLCKGIKTKDRAIQINALQHTSADAALAREGGWIDNIYSTMAELMQNCDLIIIASPLSTVIPIAEEIHLHSHTVNKLIVMDISSVKREVGQAFEKLSSSSIEYISTHPMAGKDKPGFANSQATLFVDRPWIIVPHKKNTAAGMDNIQSLIRFLGGDPMCLEAADHDRQAALISHLPALLSKSYLDFVNTTCADSLMISGPGFQSFTRLAHDNEALRKEIAAHNQANIQAYLHQWVQALTNHRGS